MCLLTHEGKSVNEKDLFQQYLELETVFDRTSE